MLSKHTILLSILFFSTSFIRAQNAWGAEVFLIAEEKPLRLILNEISNQANINLIYNDNLINDKKITCNLTSSAEKAISEVLKESGLDFKKFDNNSVVIFSNVPDIKKTKAVVSEKKIDQKLSPRNTELLKAKTILKPALLSKLELVYPEEAINKRIEGEVLTRLLVSVNGDVSEVKVERSSGHEILDTATINYVSKLKFRPAEINGNYKKVWTSILVKFNFE